jgi:hypothetical protein
MPAMKLIAHDGYKYGGIPDLMTDLAVFFMYFGHSIST